MDIVYFINDFKDFDATHYYETVKRLIYTDVRFQNISISLLILFAMFIILLIVYKANR